MTTGVVAMVMLALLIVLVIGGMRLAFVMMFLAISFGYFFRGPAVFSLFIQNTFGTMSSEILIAVPLFILMGAILQRSGSAERLFEALFDLMGPLRGGLGVAAIIISTIFAACTGIIAASVTTMAMVALPAMLKRHYKPDLATGIVCAGGSLGILIPPSVMLVMLGPMTGLSVADLFAGAIGPGLALSLFYTIYILIRSLVQKDAAPGAPPATEHRTRREVVLPALKHMIPVLGLLLLVIGSILGGIATPTEASAVGVLGSSIIALMYKTFTLRNLRESVEETIKVTAMVFFVIIGASMFTSVFLYMGGGRLISRTLLGLPLTPAGVIAIMMVTVFILGMLIDWIGILYIVVPIFMPVVIGLGLNPLWFVILIAVNLQMSFITPPFAYAIFFVKGVAPSWITTRDLYRGVVPFVAAQVIVLAISIMVPQLILWLPMVTK